MKKTSAWTTLLLAILVITPFALYITGLISNAWINRSGIILNFLAGFMVAPDLIGNNRLTKLEDRIEDYMSKFYNRLENLPYPINNWLIDNTNDLFLAYFFYIILIILFYLTVKYMPMIIIIEFVIIYLLLCTLGAYSVYKIKNLKGLGSVKIEIRRRWAIETFLMLSVFIYFILIVSPVMLGILFIVRNILDRLKGDNQLKSILVYWGVIFFIMGNLMQLVATFEMGNEAVKAVGP